MAIIDLAAFANCHDICYSWGLLRVIRVHKPFQHVGLLGLQKSNGIVEKRSLLAAYKRSRGLDLEGRKRVEWMRRGNDVSDLLCNLL